MTTTIYSMTGFGRGEVCATGVKVIVELGTVNRKHFDCNVSLPRELGCFDAKLQALIHTRISRGYVKGNVNITLSGEDLAEALIDLPKVRVQMDALRRIAAELGLADDWTASDLLHIPDMLRGDRTGGNDPEKLWQVIEQAATQALDQLVGMRQQEGAILVKDLQTRFAMLQVISTEIAPLAIQVPKNYKTTLERRLNELLNGNNDNQIDADVLAREVAIFADRCDISEELTRLTSHFAQVEQTFQNAESCGRKLDFLCQEIFREINTIGSKANDSAITRHVIAFKANLEAIREQVQNIE